jgi:hypothetical protein
MNVPTAPYNVTQPPAFALQQYVGWFVDKAVRTGRDNGYGNIVDDGIELFLNAYGVRRPVGGFVDSDGRNAQGVRNGGIDPVTGRDANGLDRNGRDAEGFNADGVNAAGQTRDEVVEDMVENWDAETKAAVLTALAAHVG